MIVSKLFEYPVKGLRGNEISCATVNRRGLAMDRRWMLVDSEGNFLSQTQLPALTQFLPAYQQDLAIKYVPSGETKSIAIREFTELTEVILWQQNCIAHGASNGINNWLSERLNTAVKLVFMDDNDIRPLEASKENDIVSFADGYPVLLGTEASLNDLNKRLDEPININRFRANIIIDGDKPYNEEAWQRIKIGTVIFKVVKLCARCHVININQETGVDSKEPLKTLSTYRTEDNKVNFGVNLIPENSGLIHLDDEVVVLA